MSPSYIWVKLIAIQVSKVKSELKDERRGARRVRNIKILPKGAVETPCRRVGKNSGGEVGMAAEQCLRVINPEQILVDLFFILASRFLK